MKKNIKIKLIKSLIGVNFKHRAIIKGLGLYKLNSVKKIIDNKCIRGMINKVNYLVIILN